MSENVSLRFALNESELGSVVRRQMRKGIWGPLWNKIVLGWIFFVTFIGDMIIIFGPWTGRSLDSFQTLVLAGLSILMVILLFFTFYPSWLLRRTVDRKAFDEQVWSFTPEDVSVKLPHATSRFDYAHLQQAWEDQQFYHIRFAKGASTPIPKRAFESRVQEETFRKLLNQKLKTHFGNTS